MFCLYRWYAACCPYFLSCSFSRTGTPEPFKSKRVTPMGAMAVHAVAFVTAIAYTAHHTPISAP